MSGRLPPIDGRVEAPEHLLRAPPRDLEARVCEAFARRLGGRHVVLYASGRAALAAALAAAAEATGRREAVLPAYTCWSVPAAAVAAGLRVRLVDVDARGRIDGAALAALPLERAAAVVVCNLFGIAEPVAGVARIARGSGACVVDDAAQSFGALAEDGPAGGRGDVGVLSFGRGKPLQALGGGALMWPRAGRLAPAARPPGRRRPPPRVRAWLRARAWNAALAPRVFAGLAAAPFLHVGETRFDPGFARGPIAGDALLLCAHALAGFERRHEARTRCAAQLAADLAARTGFAPLLAAPAASAAHPRLAVLAPDRPSRDAALERLRALGASPLYPAALDAVPPLRPHLAGPSPCAGARELAERVLTLPTHGGIRAASWQAALSALAALAPPRAGRTTAPAA